MKKTIKETFYNNKSRQGKHLYIKYEGYAPRSWKLHTGTKAEVRELINLYETQQLKKQKVKRRRVKRLKTRKGQKIRSQKPILTYIERGKSTATIKNIRQASRAEIQRAKEELINDLVKDKKIMKIMLENQNFYKLKKSLIHEVTIRDEDGEVQVKMTTHNKTINKVRFEIRKAIKEGMKKLKDANYNIIKYFIGS